MSVPTQITNLPPPPPPPPSPQEGRRPLIFCPMSFPRFSITRQVGERTWELGCLRASMTVTTTTTSRKQLV